MAEITPAKADIFQEEVENKASVSEATFTKIGGSVNFINNKQYDTHSYNFNGRYALGVGVVGADGIFPILFDMEIVGISMFNRVSGTSGTTEFDVEYLNGSNSNQGSIFTTTPKIDSTAPNYSYIIKDVLSNTDIELPAGATSPVLSKTTFNAGDALFCKIVSAMGDAEDASLLVHFRPR